MKTTLHTYRFDIEKPEQAKDYQALRINLKELGYQPFEIHKEWTTKANEFHKKIEALNGCEVELETDHIYGNQWNTESLRLMDWTHYLAENRFIKTGYYLDITQEMRDIREATFACGYCGKQERPHVHIFCLKCLGNEHLSPKELGMLRLKAISDNTRRCVDSLTAAEIAELMPLYLAAQLHGKGKRSLEYQKKRRESIAKKHSKDINSAEQEFLGMTWLMDHGITQEPIYYSHTDLFGFGWKSPLSKAVAAELKPLLVGFPCNYKIEIEK